MMVWKTEDEIIAGIRKEGAARRARAASMGRKTPASAAAPKKTRPEEKNPVFTADLAAFMGRSAYTGDPEDVAGQVWAEAGVDNAADYRAYLNGKTQNVSDYIRGATQAFLKGEEKAAGENGSESYQKGARLWGNIRHELENVPLRAESALNSTVGSLEQGAATVLKPGVKFINRTLYGTDDVSNDILISALENDADANMGAAQEDAELAAEGYGAFGQLLNKAEIAAFQMAGDVMTGNATGAMLVRAFGSGAFAGRQKGHSDLQQLGDGIQSAATEYLTEKLFGGNPIYDADAGLVNKVIERLGGSRALLTFLSSRPVESLNEFLEEVVADILNPAIDLIRYGKADWPTLRDVVDDGIVGVMLSAGGQGLQYLSGGSGSSAEEGNTAGTPAAAAEKGETPSGADVGHEPPVNIEGKIKAVQRAARSGDISRMAAALDVSERELWAWMEERKIFSAPDLANLLETHEPTDLAGLGAAIEESERTGGRSVEETGQTFSTKEKNRLQSAEEGAILEEENSLLGENGKETLSLPANAAAQASDHDPPIREQRFGPDKNIIVRTYANGTGDLDYKGKYFLHDVPVTENFRFCKRTTELILELRKPFRKARKDFMDGLAQKSTEELQQMGLPDAAIIDLHGGKTPKGFEVHHIRPLADSGTNDLNNFVLIDRRSHRALTYYQNARCRGMAANETRSFLWLMPEPGVFCQNYEEGTIHVEETTPADQSR